MLCDSVEGLEDGSHPPPWSGGGWGVVEKEEVPMPVRREPIKRGAACDTEEGHVIE